MTRRFYRHEFVAEAVLSGIPLHALSLAESGRYAAIVAAPDAYRHRR